MQGHFITGDLPKFVKVTYGANLSIPRPVQELLSMFSAFAGARDPFLVGHNERVAALAVAIADASDYPKDKLKPLWYGSILHDIGKLALPVSVLNLPRNLFPEEFEIVKTHTTIGGDLLAEFNMHPVIINSARYHHERFDGSGYPFEINGDAIPKEAQIVAIADVYDALTHDRPYRKRFRHVDAIALMQREASRFAAAYLDRFFKLIGDYLKKERHLIPPIQVKPAEV